jgi:DNA repair protein RadC
MTVETYPPRFHVELVRDSSEQSRKQLVETPQTAAEVMRLHLGRVADEHLVVLLLDAQNMLIGTITVAIGSVSACPASVKNTIRPAIIHNAPGLIVGHNHPSGKARPSTDDVAFIKKLKFACEIHEIRLLDAIIIGDGTAEVYSHGSQSYDLR